MSRLKLHRQLPSPLKIFSSNGEIVFLVDDDSSVRSVVSTFLEMRGYVVLQADGGLEALEVARNHSGPIDLLISDVAMPGMNGPKLVQALRLSRPRTESSVYVRLFRRSHLTSGCSGLLFLVSLIGRASCRERVYVLV